MMNEIACRLGKKKVKTINKSGSLRDYTLHIYLLTKEWNELNIKAFERFAVYVGPEERIIVNKMLSTNRDGLELYQSIFDIVDIPETLMFQIKSDIKDGIFYSV